MWQGVPRLLDLSFTHILQLSFMKQRERPSATVDWFTNTSMVIGFSGLPKKMWVRIRALALGFLTSISRFCLLWGTLLLSSEQRCQRSYQTHSGGKVEDAMDAKLKGGRDEVRKEAMTEERGPSCCR